VSKATTEAIQVPGLDEYVLVFSGKMQGDVGHADPARRPRRYTRSEPQVLTATAGQTFWLPKGHRYKYSFPGQCEYVAICMPRFHPKIANLQRECW
jgi:hypothetical protein